ncbi:MAG: peptidoglycan-associated lipoprotein Pal [Novosphingobium sp.]|nr:peptidoglycan-associated lipoprotein Pal [Novosphingobium sp.]
MIRPNAPVTALLLSIALVACSKKPPKELPPAPEGTGQEVIDNGGADSGAAVPGSQADFVASVASDTIYFDTDRYNVDAADGATLQSQAQWLARYPGKRVTIEGHADERGTRDYNLALGERRANAARTYLIGLGVGAELIQTVSFGKERPVALGSDESSWARNRRAVTVTVQ